VVSNDKMIREYWIAKYWIAKYWIAKDVKENGRRLI